MKKDDLRNDPIRDKMLALLSFLTKNIVASVFVAAIAIAGIVYTLSSVESEKPDYSACFNVSKSSDFLSGILTDIFVMSSSPDTI